MLGGSIDPDAICRREIIPVILHPTFPACLHIQHRDSGDESCVGTMSSDGSLPELTSGEQTIDESIEADVGTPLPVYYSIAIIVLANHRFSVVLQRLRLR
jgi:hypothetical protein